VLENLPSAQFLRQFVAAYEVAQTLPLDPCIADRSLHPTPYPTIVTFHPHPQEFFTGHRRQLLTPIAEKAAYLKLMGVQQFVLLPFDRALANLTPQAFVEEIVLERLQAQRISVGQDFCFGKGRSGTTAELEAIATHHDVAVHIAPLHTLNDARISSSAIRQALQEGEVQRAKHLLGRPYTLVGTVEQGQQLGRTLGFPTANLAVPPEKFLPCLGVYAVQVGLSNGEMHWGVMNLGNRPTVDGRQQTIEVHLLDWSGDLYGQQVVISLEQFLRSEQKFDSLDALKTQIEADCQRARSLLMASPSA
jgi:riboflavin kinase/FMN adenylyltransferase